MDTEVPRSREVISSHSTDPAVDSDVPGKLFDRSYLQNSNTRLVETVTSLSSSENDESTETCAQEAAPTDTEQNTSTSASRTAASLRVGYAISALPYWNALRNYSEEPSLKDLSPEEIRYEENTFANEAMLIRQAWASPDARKNPHMLKYLLDSYTRLKFLATSETYRYRITARAVVQELEQDRLSHRATEIEDAVLSGATTAAYSIDHWPFASQFTSEWNSEKRIVDCGDFVAMVQQASQ